MASGASAAVLTAAHARHQLQHLNLFQAAAAAAHASVILPMQENESRIACDLLSCVLHLRFSASKIGGSVIVLQDMLLLLNTSHCHSLHMRRDHFICACVNNGLSGWCLVPVPLSCLPPPGYCADRKQLRCLFFF